jgi:hypothetical protein
VVTDVSASFTLLDETALHDAKPLIDANNNNEQKITAFALFLSAGVISFSIASFFVTQSCLIGPGEIMTIVT